MQYIIYTSNEYLSHSDKTISRQASTLTYFLTCPFGQLTKTSFGSFGQAVSEKKIFRNQPTRNKNFLWQPCLLTDPHEINNLYEGPSIDASYQVSVQLAKQFQGRRFLEIDQSETRIACGSHVW